MAVNVVVECDSQGSLRLRRWGATAAGAVLLVIGSLALLVAFPFDFGAVAVIWSSLWGEPLEDMPMPPGTIVLTAAVSTALAIVCLRLGLRVVRGNRRLILFLRRFGYGEATGVVTFAAIKTIGHSWRLATLDDGDVAPVGVSTGSRLVRAVAALPGLATGPMDVVMKRVFPVPIVLALAALGLEFLGVEALRPAGTFDPYLEIIDQTLDGDLPFDAVGLTLPGLFAVACILGVVVGGIVFALLATLLVCLALSPVLALISHAADAASAAETAKRARVADESQIEEAVARLVAGSRRVFAPRLTVLTVDSDIWQKTVERLAWVSSLVIVDVSEPSDNVLWEIRQLDGQPGSRCVFVGQRDRVVDLAGPTAPGSPPDPLVHEFRQLLDGRDVLAYGTDRRDRNRFARALRNRLLVASTALDAARPSAAPTPPSAPPTGGSGRRAGSGSRPRTTGPA